MGRISSGWRWLGRVALVGAVLTLLAVGAWVAWLWETQRRMDALIAEIRARGEMVSWSELEIPEVPDEENAAWYLQQAGLALKQTSPSAYERAKTQKTWVPPSTQPTDEEKAEQAAANVQSLALLRQARGCTQNQWVKGPVSGPPIPTYTNQSTLAKVARDAAIERCRAGDDREAVEIWRDIEAQARSIGDRSVVLIGGLMALIVEGIGIDALLEIAPALRIGDDGLGAPEVRQVIAELLDDGHSREAVARGWINERTGWTDAYLSGQLALSPMKPLLTAHMHRYCSMFEGLAADTLALRESPPFQVDEYVRLIGVIPQFGGVNKDVMRCTLRRRMAATILAVRLFHVERGRYPVTLEELVPTYLEAVPGDAMYGGPVKYLLVEGGRRPVVYAAPLPWGEDEAQRILRAKKANTGAIYFDASAWDGSAQGIEDHDKQAGDGRQKQ